MDRRTKEPNELWKLLNEIAADDGVFKHKAGTLLEARKKQLKRLQKVLKAIFGLDDQPFKPYSQKDQGRRAKFSTTPKPYSRD